MPNDRYRHHPGLTRRMVALILLLAVFYVGLVVGGIYVGINPFLVIGVAVVAVFFQWYFSDRLALMAFGAVQVREEQIPDLFVIVGRLASQAGIPMPTLAVTESDVPNAFATGRSPDRATICVTTGLLDALDYDEVEAVMAHEVAHIAHRDIAVMATAGAAGVIAAVVTKIGAVTAMGAGAADSRRRSKEENGMVGAIMVVAVGVMMIAAVIWAVSTLLTRTLSRYRELAADSTGAMLTGQPSTMASALVKLHDGVTMIPAEDLRVHRALGAVTVVGVRGPLGSLTATHPPLEKRLENLAKVAERLGQPTSNF